MNRLRLLSTTGGFNDVGARNLVQSAQLGRPRWGRRLKDVAVGTSVGQQAAATIPGRPDTDGTLENVPEAAAQGSPGKGLQVKGRGHLEGETKSRTGQGVQPRAALWFGGLFQSGKVFALQKGQPFSRIGSNTPIPNRRDYRVFRHCQANC